MQLAVKSIRPAIVITILFVILVGLIYPGVVTGLGQLLFPYQANGSLMKVNGKVIGSDLIGQYWTSPRYFHGRPSATLSDNGSQSQPYNAENSGASNLGPTNKTLITTVQQRVTALQKENPGVPIPADLVTSSGSGLDPDISPEGAYFQAPLVARERGLSLNQVNQLIASHTTGRFLGIFGDSYVNVLNLNLALDQLKA
ncbi:MAG TPA: potassium-transporting ATPase subunit KdpC [Ktedonobacteraceae bacterium]|jgi:K+-transporting ATPase ATPase C chain|nr:potassium-transporting ATPase subunit KdpC [Ktedonobacteraceae bacterium]